jgi:hypothetical protein
VGSDDHESNTSIFHTSLADKQQASEMTSGSSGASVIKYRGLTQISAVLILTSYGSISGEFSSPKRHKAVRNSTVRSLTSLGPLSGGLFSSPSGPPDEPQKVTVRF